MNEQAIFLAALEISNPRQRADYLEQACANDPALRQQVDALFAAHNRSGEFLDVPALKQMEAGVSEPHQCGGETRLERNAAQDEIDLCFLQASTTPASLGRLRHYEVQEVIGRGGCGIVLKAFDEKLHRVVAIKVMAPDLAATSPARKRFLREARATAAVRHENVVSIYAVEEQPLPFLVMEYIDGHTLQQKLDKNGPLDVQEVLRIGHQIANGLQAAHAKGLIHRDIKPGNILLEDRTDHVKITDFGLARSADDASMTQSGVIAGTPLYMSPEQAQGQDIDQRSDLFSLGSVLYVMCSGRPPFRAATSIAVLRRVVEEQPRPIQGIIPEVPLWLAAIIAKLHAKSPLERFASAQELSELLARCQSELQLRGNVKSLWEILPPLPRPDIAAQEFRDKEPSGGMEGLTSAPARRFKSPRHRRWVTAAAMLLVLLAGLGMTDATGVTNVRGTVIRFFSPAGTLVVEVDDPSVSVTIDGAEMVITGTGAKEIRLKPGQYKVLASKDGQIVSQELVTVTQNGRQIVRVSQEAGPAEVIRERARSEELADPDRRAAEWVLSMKGIVQVNDGGPDITSATELPQSGFRLTSINLGHRDVDDDGLSRLEGCRHLTNVNLYYCKHLTDKGLKRLRHNRNLTTLDIAHSRVSAAGLESLLECPVLANLWARDTPIDDEALIRLARWPALSAIDLNQTRVTDAGLAHLKLGKKLTQLNLSQTRVSDAGLSHLAEIKGLKWLSLKETGVTANGVEICSAALPQCKIEWDGGVLEPTVATDPDRRAAEWVLSLGGRIHVRTQELSREIPPGAELPKEPFRLIHANLESNRQVTDAGLANLEDCKNLTHLFLQGTQVTDAGLAHFKNCKKLTHVGLQNTRVTDAGLAHFKDCEYLTDLNLDSTQVTDAGLAHFKNCKGLTHLGLQNTQVTDAGLAHFKDCKNLMNLNLCNTQVTDVGLANFKDCKSLTHLGLQNTQVTDAGLANFKDCKNLINLNLGNTQVTDLGLANFENCQNLGRLELHSTEVTDAGLAHFNDCKNLEVLNLNNTQVADAALSNLADWLHLEALGLQGTRLSQAGYMQLMAAMPSCKIEWSEANRNVAESVLALGGAVEISLRGEDKSRSIEAAADLPRSYFQVRRIGVNGVKQPLNSLPQQLSCLRFPEFDRLEKLDLSGQVGLNYGFLVRIAGLRELSLANAGLNDDALDQMPKLTTLKKLVLDGNELRNTGLRGLHNQPELIDLSLACPTLTDLAATKIAGLKQVKRLSLAGSGLTDEGLKQLGGLKNLEWLDLRKTSATKVGARNLAAALPKCKIEWDGGVIEPTVVADP